MIYEEILLYHYSEFKQSYEKKKQKGESVTIHIVKNENSKLVILKRNYKLIINWLK